MLFRSEQGDIEDRSGTHVNSNRRCPRDIRYAIRRDAVHRCALEVLAAVPGSVVNQHEVAQSSDADWRRDEQCNKQRDDIELAQNALEREIPIIFVHLRKCTRSLNYGLRKNLGYNIPELSMSRQS